MQKLKSVLALLGVTGLLVGMVLQLLPAKQAYAAQITSRSLTLQAGATDGGSKPSGVVKHLFSFTLPTSGTIHSIEFSYCTTASGTCTIPAGLSTASATLGTQTGASFDSLVAGNASGPGSNGLPYVTSAAGVSITGPEAITTQLLTVTNPDGTDCPASTLGSCTFYVRIASYTSTDATGSPIDTGTVAASTAQQIILNGTMPESLVFCTGGTIGLTAGVPDCTTATSGNVSFNQLFSPTATAIATSQMAASTNAGFGYAITVNGATLTSGSNTIVAMNPTDTSKLGHSQFGMNLRLNTTPVVGAEVNPSANGTNYKGEPKPASGYDVIDSFRYNSGDIVADSADGGAGGTDAQIFTSAYIVNVPGSQPAGTYTTTLTYICTPTF